MFYQSLTQIGLSRNEAKVYLQLLEIGSQVVSIIARRAELNRSSTYAILKSLQKKGVISSFRRGGVQYFTANDPNSLIAFLDRQMSTFDYYKSEILSLIPDFRSLHDKNYRLNTPHLNYYEGLDGVQCVLQDIASSGGEICSFIPLPKLLELDMGRYVLGSGEFSINSETVKLKAIMPDSQGSRAFFISCKNGSCDYNESVFVDANKFSNMFVNQVSIYDDKVAILHIDEGEEYALLIKSYEVANMQRLIFDIVFDAFKENGAGKKWKD